MSDAATPTGGEMARYVTIKVMVLQQGRPVFSLVTKQVPQERDGYAFVNQLQQVADRFIRDGRGSRLPTALAGKDAAD